MSNAVASDFGSAIARRIEDSRQLLASRWLEELKRVVPVAENEIFPGDELLGQMPALIQELASVLKAPARGSDRRQRCPDRTGNRAWTSPARSARVAPSGPAGIPRASSDSGEVHHRRNRPRSARTDGRRRDRPDGAVRTGDRRAPSNDRRHVRGRIHRDNHPARATTRRFQSHGDARTASAAGRAPVWREAPSVDRSRLRASTARSDSSNRRTKRHQNWRNAREARGVVAVVGIGQSPGPARRSGRHGRRRRLTAEGSGRCA